MTDAIENRRNRIREMSDELCRGKRYEAADRHVEAAEVAARVTGIEIKPDRYHDFLSGWDAAMELDGCGELQDENTTLHGIILSLCARMCVKRCEVCDGEGVLFPQVETCPHCDRGWVDLPQAEGETPK